MGDFNINVLANMYTPASDFLDNLLSASFLPLISKPTRVTNHSATLLHIICTNIQLQPKAGDPTVQGTESEGQPVLTAPEAQDNSVVAEETPESIPGMKVEEELVDAVDTNAEIDPAELFGEPSSTKAAAEPDAAIDPTELFGNFDER